MNQEKSVNMGIPKELIEVNLKREFRWLFQSEHLSPEYNTSIEVTSNVQKNKYTPVTNHLQTVGGVDSWTINSHNEWPTLTNTYITPQQKPIDTDSISVVLTGYWIDDFYNWVRAMENEKYSLDTYTLKTLDGCGHTLSTQKFIDVKMSSWKFDLNYEGSGAAKIKTILTCSKIIDVVEPAKPEKILKVGDLEIDGYVSTKPSLTIQEIKLPFLNGSTYDFGKHKFGNVTVCIKNSTSLNDFITAINKSRTFTEVIKGKPRSTYAGCYVTESGVDYAVVAISEMTMLT
jgi:hypothetical protein